MPTNVNMFYRLVNKATGDQPSEDEFLTLRIEQISAEICKSSDYFTIGEKKTFLRDNTGGCGMGSSASSGGSLTVSHTSSGPTTDQNREIVKRDEQQKRETEEDREVEQPVAPKDVMISYSHADKEMMLKMKESLEVSGITVWVDTVGLKAGVDFLTKIGQAIIDATVVISLLSETTIKSKFCQDELALAYISNKKIYPVNIQPSSLLFSKMDTGMKLQLARFQWYSLEDEARYEDIMADLILNIKTYLTENSGVQTEKHQGKSKLRRQLTNHNIMTPNQQLSQTNTGSISKMSDMEMDTFWEEHFKTKDTVDFSSFQDAFEKVYGVTIRELFATSEQEWVASILRRELSNSDDQVTKESFTKFCTPDEELIPFWYCLQEQFIQSYTIKEVFDMESSVRVEAIENLGKFDSPAVVEALTDLLSDKDNNVRAVAAISLARTGNKSKDITKHLLKCLNDQDRLVRESGCLALGHLKVEEAVPKLVNLWRNDFISGVREAAQVALEKIGGEEANKAMHMTNVLAEEIRMLTKE